LVTADEVARGGTRDDASDEALVRAALGGDESAFARLVRRHLRRAMAVALEYAPTREDAEDIVQDTFRRVVENLHRYDPARSFEPWFYTILRNTARNVLKQRRRQREEPIMVAHPTGQPGPFETTQRRQLRARIEAALERLPAMQRTCFRLCMVEGFSSVEAAAATGIAESTVRVHVLRARRSLQELLDAWRDEAGNP
jgi:RNA polymerase sigma-70 factor (ECF subfamily)